MAHTNIWRNPKFINLVKLLGIPRVHVLGHLEAMWHSAYENCLPAGRVLPEDVEVMAEWTGEPGAFLCALFKSKLLTRKKKGAYFKNFLQHAPAYVLKRVSRMKLQRRSRQTNVRHCPDNVRQCLPTERDGTERKGSTKTVRARGARSDSVRLKDLTADNKRLYDMFVEKLYIDPQARKQLPGLIDAVDWPNLQIGCLGRLIAACQRDAKNQSAYLISSLQELAKGEPQ